MFCHISIIFSWFFQEPMLSLRGSPFKVSQDEQCISLLPACVLGPVQILLLLCKSLVQCVIASGHVAEVQTGIGIFTTVVPWCLRLFLNLVDSKCMLHTP